jgi:hypothetical protein
MAAPGDQRVWDADSLQLDFFNFLQPTPPRNASTLAPSTRSSTSESKAPTEQKQHTAVREERPRSTVKAYLNKLMSSSAR